MIQDPNLHPNQIPSFWFFHIMMFHQNVFVSDTKVLDEHFFTVMRDNSDIHPAISPFLVDALQGCASLQSTAFVHGSQSFLAKARMHYNKSPNGLQYFLLQLCNYSKIKWQFRVLNDYFESRPTPQGVRPWWDAPMPSLSFMVVPGIAGHGGLHWKRPLR